ncbi:MAG: hypothetical protein AB8H03_01125 [Saprospiraceae bacterium]
MTELFQAALSAENIIYTVLLVLVLFYWLSVIAGGLDMNAFDIDLDTDLDVDLDVDADVDGAGGTSGWLAGALHFFNFGKLPTMVILSFAILFAWMINVLLNHYMGGGSLVFALMLMIPNLFISLLLTKIITTPLIPIFQQLNTPEEDVDFIGMTCKLTVTANKTKKGQAEVIHKNRSLLIYVKVDDDVDMINKGEEAIILRPSKDTSYFFIRKPTEIVF